MKKTLSLLFAIALLAVPSFAASAPAIPAAQKAGNISALLPVAHIDRGTGKARTITEAKKGDELRWLDTIKTDKGGRARIQLADGSLLSLGSQAELRIEKHDARTQQSSFILTAGRLRAEVQKIVRDGGGFTVRTPTAVAGVIGTDFSSLSDQFSTNFVCISGTVSITGTDLPDRVLCNAGQSVTVEKGKAPGQPKPATPEQIQQVIQDTEPAIISAIAPASAMPGTNLTATVTGAHMAGILSANVTGGPGVTATVQPSANDTSLTVQIAVAPGAPTGPRTITFHKKAGPPAGAVFTVIDAGAAGGDPAAIAKQFTDILEQERSSGIAGLNGLLIGLQQTVQQAAQQIDAANTAHVDTNAIQQQFRQLIDQAVSAAQSAGGTVNTAAQGATADIQGKVNQLAGAQPPPDPAQLRQQAGAAFTPINNTFNDVLRHALDGLSAQIAQANAAIGSITQASVAQMQQAARNAGGGGGTSGGEKSVNLGDPFTFTAGRNANSYQWTLLPAGSPTPLNGYASNTSDFVGQTCNLNPGDYTAKLTGADAQGSVVTESYTLHVLPPSYDDPSTTLRNLAAAYSALQSSQFLNFFDPSFGGFTALQENIRRTFPTLASMNINLRISQSQINCNDATVRADWDQNYSFLARTNLVLHQTEQLSARFLRTPGKGWSITEFQGDNGTVQGLPPGPSTTEVALPELQVVGLVTTAAQSGSPTRGARAILPISTGNVNVKATVKNIGSAPLNQSVVIHVSLTDPATNELAGSDLTVNPPLAVGQQTDVTGTVNVPPLPPGTNGQFIAIVNPGCVVPTENCGATSTSTQQVVIATIDLGVQSLTVGGTGLIATLPGSIVVSINNSGTSTSQPGTLTLTAASAPAFTATAAVPAIAPNTSVNVTVSFTTPNLSGSQAFTARVTAPFDSNAANDVKTTSFNVFAPVVDLQLLSLTLNATGSLGSGQSTSLTAQIKNNGSAPSAATDTMTCTLSGPLGTSNLGSRAVPSIAGGATLNFSYPFVVPANRTGNDTINCVLATDPLETVTNNNTGAVSAVVSLNIDLVFDTPPPIARNYQMGSSTTLSVAVRNAGLDTTNAAWVMVVKINGSPVATVNGPTLIGGQVATLTTPSFTIPNLQPPPADVVANMSVELNPTNTLTETNTQNNIFAATANLQDFQLVPAAQNFQGIVNRLFNASVVNVLPATYSNTLGPAINYTNVPAGLAPAGTPLTKLQGQATQTGTFNVGASGTAAGVTHASASPVVLVFGPEFTATPPVSTTVSNVSGTTPFVVNLTGGLYPASVTLTLPGGLTTLTPLTQTLNGPGLLTWQLSSPVGTTPGSYTVAGHVTDGGIPATNTPVGNVNFSAGVTVNNAPPQANYTITGVSVAGHSAPPFSGGNAFVLGEPVAIVATVTNNGGVSASGTITVTFDCTTPVVCTPLAVPVAAPGAGQSVLATFNIPNFGFPFGSYSGSISLTTTIQQSSTADDTINVPFEVITMALSPAAPNLFTPVQNMPIGRTSTLNMQLSETGPSPNTVVAMSATTGISGVVSFSGNPAAPGTVTASITPSSQATPGAGTVQVTATLHNATQTVTQPVQYYSAQVVDFTFPSNGPSFPATIQPSNSIQVTFQFNGTWDARAGTATLAVAPVNGFSASFTSNQINPGDVSTLTLSAFGSVPLQVTGIPITLTIPNTFPVDTINYVLYVLPQNLPDLSVTNLVGPSGRNFTTNPWLAGETLTFTATVNNFGQAPTHGSEELHLFVNGTGVNSVFLPSTPIPPGFSIPVNIPATAPFSDPNFVSANVGSIPVSAQVFPITQEANSFNNFFATNLNMADWDISIAGGFQGTSGNPLQMFAPSLNTASTRLTISLFGSGAPVATFTVSPGLVSTNIQFQSTALTLTTLNSTSGYNTTAQLQQLATSPQGPYYAQVIATLPAGVGVFAGRQMQRQQTITIANNTSTPIATVQLSSNRGNFAPLTGSAPPLQMNGLLPEAIAITPTRVGSPSFPCTTGNCPGHVDITFSDNPSGNSNQLIDSNPHQVRNVAYFSIASAVFTYVPDVSGAINATAMSTQVSAEAVTVNVASGTPSPFGSNVLGQLLFNVGDLNISTTVFNGFPCVVAVPGGSGQLPLSFAPINGFNLAVITSWQWAPGSLPPGVSVSPSAGTGSTLPTFTFTNTNSSSTATALATIQLVVTTQNALASVPVTLDASIDTSTTGQLCNLPLAPQRVAHWGAAALSAGTLPIAIRPARTAALPELTLNTADVSYSPSVPRTGDSIEVRFRLANTGNGAATRVPVALRVNGTIVARDNFDVAAGRTTLGALRWENAQLPAPSTPTRATRPGRGNPRGGPAAAERDTAALVAEIVVDPDRTIQQSGSGTNQVARLQHFALAESDTTATTTTAGPQQRAYIEVNEATCVGFRFASGGTSQCDSADVEIAVAEAGTGSYTLSSQSGIADLGLAAAPQQVALARYSQQAAAIAGHSYAVQLSGGRVGILTLQSVRNPGQLDARTKRLFRGGPAAGGVRSLGRDSGPVEAGDVSGNSRQAVVYFEIVYATP